VTAVVFGVAACNDAPGPPSGPGNVLVNDTNEPDAVVPQPPPPADAGMDAYADTGPYGTGGGYQEGGLASMGYLDVQSPQAACSSCKCSNKYAFCLENGASSSVTAAPNAGGFCAYAPASTLEVGCNPFPAACAANPTCECLLDALQPPLPCYPECTTALGYFDVFCIHP
jgi:hypothetical protein